MSPALETPPPITNTCGSTVAATWVRAPAKIAQSLSTSAAATASPAFASSKIFFAYNVSYFLRLVGASFAVVFVFGFIYTSCCVQTVIIATPQESSSELADFEMERNKAKIMMKKNEKKNEKKKSKKDDDDSEYSDDSPKSKKSKRKDVENANDSYDDSSTDKSRKRSRLVSDD